MIDLLIALTQLVIVLLIGVILFRAARLSGGNHERRFGKTPISHKLRFSVLIVLLFPVLVLVMLYSPLAFALISVASFFNLLKERPRFWKDFGFAFSIAWFPVAIFGGMYYGDVWPIVRDWLATILCRVEAVCTFLDGEAANRP